MAAADVDKMENLLTCSVCLGILQDPRTLGCFHSFCKDCLKKFVKCQREKKAAEAAQRGGEVKTTEFEEFFCPVCRSTFRLKQGEEVEGMTPNHFICNMLEVLAIQRQAKEIQCSLCQGPSVCRCISCNLFLCSKCKSAHENWLQFKKHTLLTMAELAIPENQGKARGKPYCERHQNKSLKFYCEICQELVCRYCMDFNHAKENHSCLLAEDVAAREREAIRVLCGTLEESLNEGQKVLADISNTTKLLETHAEKAKEDIIHQKESILKTFPEKLEEKAKIMLDEVERKYTERYEPLAKQESELQVYVEKVKGSLDLSKNLLEKGNDEEILSSKKMIEENVERVKSERPKQMKPVHDGVMEFNTMQVDYGPVLDNLGKIICAPASSILNLCNTSSILKEHKEYLRHLEEWVDDEFQWRLCYRASTDGWDGRNFHGCCDDKGPTVTLVKVNDYIFGGYTDQSWEGNGYKHSTSSFLFSLSNKDNLPSFKAPIKKGKGGANAVYCKRSFGPTFGSGHDLHISSTSNGNQNSYSNFGYSYDLPAEYKHGNAKSLLAGNYMFTPTEIEVFY